MVWGGGVFTLHLYCIKHSVIPNLDIHCYIVYLFSAAMIVQTRAKPSLLELCRVQPIFTFSRLQRYGNNLCNTVAEIASALVFGQKSEKPFHLLSLINRKD